MGGRSDGRFRITDARTLEFSGAISLENNGGFASLRSVARSLGLAANDTIVLRVRGDGREYSLNLYTTNRRMASSYRAPIPTTKDQWTEIAIPMRDFVETSFGRIVPNAGPVDAAKVNAVGFMLSDKQSGPFRLEVEWIKVRRQR
jgi:monofunctional biosynthetic peptidoglycan transglycosylase